MKELLIKIKALFEGQGTDQAKAAVEGIGSAADKAGSGGLGKLQGWIDGAAAKAGILGGAVSALGAGLITFAAGAVTSAIGALRALVTGFADGIKGAADFADRMSEVADQTGQSVETVMVMGTAFENAGIGAGAVAPAINKLQRALAGANEEGAPTAEAFNRLGLSIESLKAMSPDQAFAAIGQSISAIKDPTVQAQVAFDIFGRSSVQLMGVLKDSQAFTVAKEQIGSLAENTAKMAPELGKFSDALTQLGIKAQQFFMGATIGFAGEFSKAAEAMNKMDLGALGQQVGEVLRGVYEWGKAFGQATAPILDILGALGRVNSAVSGIVALIPGAGLLNQLGAGLDSLAARGQQASQVALDVAAASKAATVESADATMARILAETQGNLRQGATTAQTSIAQTAAEGSKQIGLTAEQLKAATVALAQEMAKGNADVVTPAMQALTASVQESFARIAGEVTSVATTLTEAQRAQGEANQEAIREAVAGLGEAQQAANAETGRAIQAAIAAVQQSNSALASSVASAIGSLQGQLANLQAQINSLASRA